MVKRDIDTFLGCNFFVRGTIEFIKQPEEGGIWIVAGQSNAAGRGDVADLPPDLLDDYNPVLYGRQIECKYAYPDPCDEETELGSLGVVTEEHGIELQFGRDMDEKHDGRTCLLQCASGGTSLNAHWVPRAMTGFQLYNRMLDYYHSKSAETGLKCKGFIWIQGEADARFYWHSLGYENNLINLFNCLKEDVEPDMKFYVVQLHKDCDKEFVDNLRASQAAAVAAEDNATLVDIDDYPLQVDNLHWTSGTYISVGSDIAALT